MDFDVSNEIYNVLIRMKFRLQIVGTLIQGTFYRVN